MKHCLYLVLTLILSASLGYVWGYIIGAESTHFNMVHANKKLVDCQELIYASR
jgi:hypothetical protein